MIRKNFWIKLTALLLAIGLWMFVISKGRSEISLPVELEVVNIPEGLVLTKYPPDTVILSVSGHERFLHTISPDDIRVEVDLSNFKAGKHIYHIGRSDVQIPSPLKIESINPSAIDLTLAQAQMRKVPVRSVLAGRPAEGYVVNSVEVVPNEINVVGTKEAIRKLHFVETEAVDVSGRTETFETQAAIRTNRKLFTVQTPSVKVRVVIGKEPK